MSYLIIIAMLLVFSALFSSCETAFSSVNKIRLKHRASQGEHRAEKALILANAFDNALTAILIGNNVINILSASLGTILFTKWFGAKGVGISTAVMTVLVLIFGEILPKSYAKANAERCALFFAAPLSILVKLMTPFVLFFQALSKLFVSRDDQPSVTEAELKVIIEEIEEQGVLEEQESELVRSALEFDEIVVNKILIPRVNITAVERHASVEEIKHTFLTEMYSRLPVYDKNIDNIVGLITCKDFFRLLASENPDIQTILQDVMYISDLKLISEALREMQRRKVHLAIVKDQYGGTAGMITMEDIIEELVGEIYDENDEIIPILTKQADADYIVSGEMSISDLLEELALPDDLIETESATVGGWVMEILGQIPTENDTFSVGIFQLTVLAVDDQKIESVRLQLNLPTDEPDEE